MNPLAAFLLLPTGLLAAAACAAASSSFTMSLTPPGVVGTFVWTNACCRVSGEGLVFSFSRDGGCACGGCVATGFFSYEGYRLPAPGVTVPWRPSGGEGGIVVTATFEENGTGEAWTMEDRATAVRVRLCPEVYAPQNECVYRHRVGIGEVVNCEIMPDVQDVIFVVLGKGRFFSASGQYICPLKAEQNWLKVVGGGAEYVPQTSVVEPSPSEAPMSVSRLLGCPLVKQEASP